MDLQDKVKAELELADQEIRSGQSKSANRRARQLLVHLRKLDTPSKIRLGNILRRSGDYKLCTRVLHAMVRVNVESSEIIDQAKIEYAGALVQFGLTIEARELLEPLSKYPQALLIMGLSYFQEWNHREAIVPLEKLLNTNLKLSEYELAVAKVNLYVAYSFAEPDKLHIENLLELKKQLIKTQAHLLLGVMAQLIGRYWMNNHDYSRAHEIFQEGLSFLSNTSTYEIYILRKWKLVCESIISEKNISDQSRLLYEWEELKNASAQAGHFETVRDCDYFCGVYLDQSYKLNFCYHGTPYPRYRDRFQKCEKDIGIVFSASEAIKPFAGFSNVRLDEVVFPQSLKTLKNLKKLFLSLLSDFYRPQTLPRLFQAIYPNQYWNPFSSPVQLRQLIFRLRQHLVNIKCGLQIVEKKGKYQLQSVKEQIIFSWNSSWANEKLKQVEELVNEFGYAPFSFDDFARMCGGSLRTQRRKMKQLMESQIIEKMSSTKAAKYKVIS